MSHKLPDAETPAYLTPDEAAKILRVDRNTIHTWLREGKMKGVKFGHTWRIPREAVLPTEK